MLSNPICHRAPTQRVLAVSGFTTSKCDVFSSQPGACKVKVGGYLAESGGRMREARIHGGPGGCSEGSFAPFLVAMWVSGERTDVKAILMDAGGGHQAAGLGGNREPVCLSNVR